jgi:hypothetical protein
VQGKKSEEEIEAAASSSGSFYTPEQISAMDPKQVSGVCMTGFSAWSMHVVVFCSHAVPLCCAAVLRSADTCVLTMPFVCCGVDLSPVML